MVDPTKIGGSVPGGSTFDPLKNESQDFRQAFNDAGNTAAGRAPRQIAAGAKFFDPAMFAGTRSNVPPVVPSPAQPSVATQAAVASAVVPSAIGGQWDKLTGSINDDLAKWEQGDTKAAGGTGGPKLVADMYGMMVDAIRGGAS